MKKLAQVIRQNPGTTITIALLNLGFIVITLFLNQNIPYAGGPGGAPDEVVHYGVNAEFILKNGRLPVSGVDDLTQYRSCRENPFGALPCTISYTVYPGLNYVASAAAGWVFPKFLPVNELHGARIASMLWGLIFLNSLIVMALKWGPGRKLGLFGVCAIAFIPQVLFISSYVSPDIHSLAISALVCLATLLLLEKYTRGRLIFFAIAFGLIFSAKYNYLIYAPAVVALLAYHWRQGRFSLSQARQIALASAIASVVISGFWYIRNLVLYQDPLGQGFMLRKMSEFQELGKAQGISFEAFLHFVENYFVETTIRSFFAAFGYMNVVLPEGYYTVIEFLLFAGVVYFVYDLSRTKLPDVRRVAIGFGVFVLAVVALHIGNSLRIDYQPQGRYLFPILVPLALTLFYAARRHQLFRKYIVVFGVLTAYVLYAATGSFIRYYLEFIKSTGAM